MEIQEEKRAGWTIVRLVGRVDALNAEQVEAALVGAVTAGGKVAIDGAAMDYISSAGLRAILQGARAAQQQGAEYEVCALKPAVKTVFDMCGMENVLRVKAGLPC